MQSSSAYGDAVFEMAPQPFQLFVDHIDSIEFERSHMFMPKRALMASFRAASPLSSAACFRMGDE
jgi:hypothetical protein